MKRGMLKGIGRPGGAHKTDTDKYEMQYHLINEEMVKTVWENDISVGPGAFNNGNVDIILYQDRNNVRTVLEGYKAVNPYYTTRGRCSRERAKFIP